MMRVLATIDCSRDDITLDSLDSEVVGDVSFVCGRLARILKAEVVGQRTTPLSRQGYYVHKVLCFEHIINS